MEAVFVVAQNGQFAAQQFHLQADGGRAGCAAGEDDFAAASGGFQGRLQQLGIGRTVKDGFGAAPAGGFHHSGNGIAIRSIDQVGCAVCAGEIETGLD